MQIWKFKDNSLETLHSQSTVARVLVLLTMTFRFLKMRLILKLFYCHYSETIYSTITSSQADSPTVYLVEINSSTDSFQVKQWNKMVHRFREILEIQKFVVK